MLVQEFDAILSDLDGVVYAGSSAIEHAVESLTRLEEFGVGLAYVTNNASRSPAQVAQHLRDLGAPALDEQVVSSSQAAAALLAERLEPSSFVLIIGSEALAAEINLVGLHPIWSAEQNVPAAVVQGFDPKLGWQQLAEASYAVTAGALWVATNTDMTIPQQRGIAPGNGTLVGAVKAATGKEPVVAGKPEAPLFFTAAKRLGAKKPLVVGDRLDTDIRGGNNARFATAAVLTGIDSLESILAACTIERPNFILNNLSELYQPYPEVVAKNGGYTCGSASAQVHNDELHIDGSVDDLDAWRAACAAWWAANPDCESATDPVIHWSGH
ncbi:HAD-IIA family hydrolase [Pseudarthrobacter sp. J1738]|uniref:HAD-IIA family hydrolase n=1 Tax=Pseudarthrobacter sp. J1738 TaxID=3420446 RepID=UPI003D279422